MKKILLSVFSLFLTFILLISASSCSLLYPNDDSPDETEEEIDSGENFEEKIASLENKDFEGKKFRIATDDIELIMPSNSSNIFSKRKYEMVNAVEKKYNVKIVTTEESGLVTINEKIKIEANAGTDYCDLAIINATALQNLITLNLATNINSIPYIDSSADCYYGDAVNSMSIGSNLYGLCGDITYKPDNLYVVYFNQDIINSIGLPSLYDLVLSNQWDIENFREYSKAAYAIKRDGGWKTYGYSSSLEQQQLINVFWAASGQRYLKNEKGTAPQLIYNNETTINTLNQIDDTLFNAVYSFSRTKNALDNFKVGNCLFYIGTLSEIEEITKSNQKWGVVPIPKIDINQDDFYSFMGLDYEVACFPNKPYDPIFSGLITQALFTVFSDTVKDDFLSNYLNLYLPNLNSGYMIQKAIETPYYDPALFLGAVYNEISASTYTVISRTLTTSASFDTLYSQGEKQFNKFTQSIN